MASIKVYSLGGLDKKSNDLTRSPEKASDMLNMEYDIQSSLKKRNGYEVVSAEDADDIVEYGYKGEKLLFKNGLSNVTILKGDYTTRTLALPSGISALANVSISYTENQNNIYFTNTDYSTYVMKYDGSNIYRAGLPTPRVGQVSMIDTYPSYSATTSGYTRIFYKYKDINGNVIYSPYVQLSVAPTGAANLSINSLKTDSNCTENGFLGKYCYVVNTGSASISSSSRTLTVTRHNYVAGEKFLIDTENRAVLITPSSKSYLVLDIESVTSTTITFTAASLGTNSFVLRDLSLYYVINPEYPVDIRTQVEIYRSSSDSTGYTRQFSFVIDNGVTTNTIPTSLSDRVLAEGILTPIPFEDIYDSTTLKIMPPICKYIASFGDQIAYGSVQSFFTSFDTSTLNAPNQRVQYANNDIFIYSDISAGDGPEGVSELNTQKVGETWDGDITGMRRCNDSLVIFKNRGVFSVDGTLISGEYQLRKLNTDFVGCTSHKSILESDGGLYFQGHNGIYYTNAIGVKKITSEIDSVFGSGSYTSTRSVRMKKKQKALFYVPELSKVVVIDYYYNQVYMWDSINASCGFIENSSGDVFFSNGTSVYKFNDGYLDDGQAISAYYSTTWHHAGEPSLNKKWLSMRLFALTADAFTATVKTEGNWAASTYLTTNTMDFSSSDQTKFLMLDMQTKRSLRITFSNAVKKETALGSGVFIGENLAITGYELSFELYNNVDKN